jgi:AcrR family transcriptional regulator
MIEVTMRERKKESTKNTILKAGVELINGKGYAETTMQMIAEKADVALRTLYNYFPSKEAIVAVYMQTVVIEEEQKQWDELLTLDSTYERLRFIFAVSAAWAMNNPMLIEIYASDPRNYYYANQEGVPRSGMEELVARVLEMGQKMGDITSDFPVESLVRQFVGIFYLGIMTWLRDKDQDLYAIFDEGLDILFKGINPDDAGTARAVLGMFC